MGCQHLAGELAQLARALALQARGHRFESDILHIILYAAWLMLHAANSRPAKVYTIPVDPSQLPCRLDKLVQIQLPDTTRSQVQLAIRQGWVRVNAKSVKSGYSVKPNDMIRVSWPEARPQAVVPEPIPLNILHEDGALLVLNKAAGMAVHPGHGRCTGTLVNALVHYVEHLPCLPDYPERPGLVHRLDKDTSGLMVVAKTAQAHAKLALQFHDHSVERTYEALVWGNPDPPEGTIDLPLGRCQRDRRLRAVVKQGGKSAVTHYKVTQNLGYVSLITCRLGTGRTHQIRAHMAHQGHPIFGDKLYGGQAVVKGQRFSKYKAFVTNCFKAMPRQALHAGSLGFIHPVKGEHMHFTAARPSDFATVVDKWVNYADAKGL